MFFPFRGRARRCDVGGACGQPELRSGASADRSGGRFFQPDVTAGKLLTIPTSLFDGLGKRARDPHKFTHGFTCGKALTFPPPLTLHTYTSRVPVSDNKVYWRGDTRRCGCPALELPWPLLTPVLPSPSHFVSADVHQDLGLASSMRLLLLLFLVYSASVQVSGQVGVLQGR